MTSSSKTKAGEKAKDAEKKDQEKEKQPEVPKDPFVAALDEIRENCRLIERTVVTKESRFVVRVLRSLYSLRKKVTAPLLKRCVWGYYTHSAEERDALLAYIPDLPDDKPLGDKNKKSDEMEDESMDVDQPAAAEAEEKMDVDQPEKSDPQKAQSRLRGAKSALTPLVPEVDAYLHLLILLYLLDREREPLACVEALMVKLASHNRRTLDHIAAKAYYYYFMAYEKIDREGSASKVRGVLHARLRSSTLRNDFEGQAVLINCLLRSYINQSLFDQADKLVNKTNFPENASNNECARYLYYLGRIRAIQLEYSEAQKKLVQSLRKAPQYSAVGFRHTVLKLSVTVELLLGEIPERKTFLAKDNKKALAPYFLLTQAVRLGDVERFQKTLETYFEQFRKDNTLTLIQRLHHNVIKTGIRTISLAYSRISLAEVAKKLKLDSPVDAEYICAKAIRDGVIEATLDHENGCMQSKDTLDIYSTREPQHAFHQRIQFCLDLHNSSIKAMRFPKKSYHEDLESAEERRERDAQELELAKEMAEDDDDMI